MRAVRMCSLARSVPLLGRSLAAAGVANGSTSLSTVTLTRLLDPHVGHLSHAYQLLIREETDSNQMIIYHLTISYYAMYFDLRFFISYHGIHQTSDWFARRECTSLDDECISPLSRADGPLPPLCQSLGELHNSASKSPATRSAYLAIPVSAMGLAKWWSRTEPNVQTAYVFTLFFWAARRFVSLQFAVEHSLLWRQTD